MESIVGGFPADILCRLRWVFVDLDDTLWDFSANSAESLRLLYERYAELRSVFSDFASFSSAYHELNASLWSRYHHGDISRDKLMRDRFALLLTDAFPHEQVEELWPCLSSAYLNFLADQTRLVDGACRFLESVSSKYMVGVLSNGFNEVQYRKLYNSGLWRYVTRMVLSDEIGVQKPGKEIFDYALREVGCDASEVVMIGDNPDADIAGAVGAGWHAMYLNRRGEALRGYLSEEVPEFHSLAEVAGFLGV